MEKINEILAHQNVSAPQQISEQPKRVIDEFWNRMTQIYGHKWVSAHGEIDHDTTWGKGLAGLSLEQIKKGFIACVKRADPWPPSLPEFRALCKPPQRENETMYRYAGPMLPHKLTDEQKATAAAALAEMKQRAKRG